MVQSHFGSEAIVERSSDIHPAPITTHSFPVKRYLEVLQLLIAYPLNSMYYYVPLLQGVP